MAYSIACRETGLECPGVFTTETEEELIEHAQLHVEKAHPDLSVTPDQIKALIRDVTP